ncbi:MAG TPA: hypothetical protein VI455_09190 [Terriglobia bacterium]
MKRAIHLLLSGIFLIGALPVFAAPQDSAAPPSSPAPQASSTQNGSDGQKAAASTAPQLTQSASQVPFDPTKQPLVLPAGSVLHVRLTTTLTSKTNQSGDPFTGMVTQPVVTGDKTLVPEGSLVQGHVSMVKSSGRVAGRASMRVVLDKINTPDDVNYNLAASLQDLSTSTCTKGIGDNEGTVEGCGKSKKSAAEGAAIVGGIGAATGASIGATQDMICRYYGCPGQNPNIGLDAAYGAGIGAGTALLYSLLKHEKQVVLVSGSDLTFVVNHTVEAAPPATTASASEQP